MLAEKNHTTTDSISAQDLNIVEPEGLKPVSLQIPATKRNKNYKHGKKSKSSKSTTTYAVTKATTCSTMCLDNHLSYFDSKTSAFSSTVMPAVLSVKQQPTFRTLEALNSTNIRQLKHADFIKAQK